MEDTVRIQMEHTYLLLLTIGATLFFAALVLDTLGYVSGKDHFRGSVTVLAGMAGFEIGAELVLGVYHWNLWTRLALWLWWGFLRAGEKQIGAPRLHLFLFTQIFAVFILFVMRILSILQ